ncbi:hypothetical protein FJ365_00090 [Candidatus Dependentiae bacterium]|nr:hypothetical protein [Candidatus Dependentiae bacterium]
MNLIIILLLSSIFCGNATATERRDSSVELQAPGQQTMDPLGIRKQCLPICPPHCHAYCQRTWYAKMWACTKFPCTAFPEEEHREDGPEDVECACLCRVLLMPIAISITCICDCCLLFDDPENADEN